MSRTAPTNMKHEQIIANANLKGFKKLKETAQASRKQQQQKNDLQ